jgi:hypothetical protein
MSKSFVRVIERRRGTVVTRFIVDEDRGHLWAGKFSHEWNFNDGTTMLNCPVGCLIGKEYLLREFEEEPCDAS